MSTNPANPSQAKARSKEFASYVLGFLFSEVESPVVLIVKDRPTWQAGCLNGIGGKVEAGETNLQAMVREFLEETGVDTKDLPWREFCRMGSDAFECTCFTVRNTAAWNAARTMGSEKIVKVWPDELYQVRTVSNLRWLVEMARDENQGRHFYAAVEYPG